MSGSDALMMLWTDRMTVSTMESYKRGNGSTGQKTVVKIKNAPCRLSFSNLAVTDATKDVAQIVQSAKLFCAAEFDIPAGSQIEVSHAGRDFVFKRSGAPGVYPITNHQEIPLVPTERWA